MADVARAQAELKLRTGVFMTWMAKASHDTESLRAALRDCIGWMEPVQEGFGVAKDSGAGQILERARRALAGEPREASSG